MHPFVAVSNTEEKNQAKKYLENYFDIFKTQREPGRGKPFIYKEKEGIERQLKNYDYLNSQAFLAKEEFYVVYNQWGQDTFLASPDEFANYFNQLDDGDQFIFHAYLISKKGDWMISFAFDLGHLYVYGG